MLVRKHSIKGCTSNSQVGTIIQYAHKFAYLFHSISQAVYYNYPTYARKRQVPLESFQAKRQSEAQAAQAVNFLPCLREIAPEIPIYFEHTGAGCTFLHRGKWSWILWGAFVFLLSPDLHVFASLDIRVPWDRVPLGNRACTRSDRHIHTSQV